MISVAIVVQNTMKKSLFMAALEVVGMWAEERVKDTDRWLWSLFNNKKTVFSSLPPCNPELAVVPSNGLMEGGASTTTQLMPVVA